MIFRKHFLNFIFPVFTLLSTTCSFAGEGERLLDRFLQNTNTMSATFKQQLRDEDGEVMQESSGQFYLERPGRFRWNYTKPYQREIVSDGEYIWIYDIDLEQVTVQKQSTSLRNTPMALMHDRAKLDEVYSVSELDNRDGVHRIKLVSKSLNADFSEFVVGVDQTGLRFMQLHDQFDQTTDIVFDDLQSNISLESALFNFEPPAGVDVFGDY